jgi:Bacteriophage Sf6, terminase small subunit-like
MPYGVRFDPDLARQICEALADGKSLTAICRDPGMPDRHTVRRWLADPANGSFREAHDAARLAWADTLFEEIAELGEEARRVAEAADTKGHNSNAAVAAIREEIRAKQWVCARLRPDKYGDRIAAEVTGAGGKDLIPASREARLPQLVAALAVLLPGQGNGELFGLAGALLDRLDAPAVPALENGDDSAG